MQRKPENLDVAVLREKIRIKKRDRKVYGGEIERKLKSNREKRTALRIGNDCVRYMTQKQMQMSTYINSKIFADRPRDLKLPMLVCDLETSVKKNDARLFKYGKRLMKQDYKKGVMQQEKEDKLRELEWSKMESEAALEDYNKRCEDFLHEQIRADDFKAKSVAAKLICKKYRDILAQLLKDLSDYPFIIKEVENKIKLRKIEVQEFMASKEGALRILELEESALGPLNEELKIISNHFEKIIAHERKELDERRKTNALGKFLADREAHVFNFTGSSTITEMKIQARNKALVNSQDMILKLMDAMLLWDVQQVVDCILDQSEVKKLLEDEMARRGEENEDLRSDHKRLEQNNSTLKFNQLKKQKQKKLLQDTLDTEKEEIKRLAEVDKCLGSQDVLMSNLFMALHGMFELVRPVKLAEEAASKSEGQSGAPEAVAGAGGAPEGTTRNLVADAELLIKKIRKMQEIVQGTTQTIGSVKPLLLRLFKEKRVPGDSIRIHMQQASTKSHDMEQVLETFEADKPGFTTREMLKARAEETLAKTTKKKAS